MKQLINKWENRLKLHLKASKDVNLTQDVRLKNYHYAQAILTILHDLNKETKK